MLQDLFARDPLVSAKVVFLSSSIGNLSSLNLRLDSQLYTYYEDHASGGFKIRELYSLKRGPMLIQEVGYWSPLDGLVVPVPNAWKRRSNLRGTTLVSGLLSWALFNRLETNTEGAVVGNSGIMADVTAYLALKMNFTESIVQPEDEKWGGVDPTTGQWNGIIGMLQRGEIDLTAGGLMHTRERDDVADFSVPLEKMAHTLLARADGGPSSHFWVYMQIFPADLWLIAGLSTAAVGAAFFLIGRAGGGGADSLASAMGAMFLLQIQLDSRLPLTSPSGRLLFLFASAMTYVLFAYYTCDLTARMTFGPRPIDVKSFDEAYAKKFRVIAVGSTTYLWRLKSAPEGSGMRKIYRQMASDPDGSLVASTEEGLSRVLADTSGGTLLYSSSMAVRGRSEFVALGIRENVNVPYGLTLQKDSELTQMVNYHISQMLERGIVRKIYRVHN